MKMKHFIVTLLVYFLAKGVCRADPHPQRLRLKPEIANWSWVKEPWTGNDTPFLRARRQIDMAFKKPTQIEVTTQRYENTALAHPRDALAQYAWAYAACAGRPIGIRTRGSELADIAVALDQAPSPKSSEYDRVRFIVTVRWVPYPQLKPLGKRLLQRDANDYRVKRGVVDLLAPGSLEEQKEAMIYAQQLVASYPKRSGSYSSLGWVYDLTFAKQKDIAAGDKAIAAYRKFIALSNDPIARQGIMHSINVIQQEQRQLRAKGKA